MHASIVSSGLSAHFDFFMCPSFILRFFSSWVFSKYLLRLACKVGIPMLSGLFSLTLLGHWGSFSQLKEQQPCI